MAGVRDNERVMTLTQLNAFVLVARLGSVTAAANALGVSEPAVSQALSALRQHLGDQLITRGPAGMTLTAGGSRLLATASQIVVLGAEAHAAVRAAQGAPEQLRVVATSTIAEFVVSPLIEAFTRRFAGLGRGVGRGGRDQGDGGPGRQPAGRRGDRPRRGRRPGAAGGQRADLPLPRSSWSPPGSPSLRGSPRQWRWLVDPSGTDPGSDTGQLLAALRIPDDHDRRVPQPDRRLGRGGRRRRGGAGGRAPGRPAAAPRRAVPGRAAGAPVDGCWHVTLLERQHRSAAASSLRRFLGTPEAMQLMRSPAAGVPPSRFRPPVYVTIWS